MSFQFDTSGAVLVQGEAKFPVAYEWSDLSPFVQGYVEAMMEALRKGDLGYMPLANIRKELAFKNIAPETLARIMETNPEAEGYGNTINGGRNYWADNKLQPYLGDDGKVYIK